MVWSAERLNKLGRRHWGSFAGQQYFDPSGVFMSAVVSGPLLLIMFVVLVRLCSGAYMQACRLLFCAGLSARWMTLLLHTTECVDQHLGSTVCVLALADQLLAVGLSADGGDEAQAADVRAAKEARSATRWRAAGG